MGWIISKNYKRYKTSIYLRQDIYERLSLAAKRNELSFSSYVSRILEKG